MDKLNKYVMVEIIATRSHCNNNCPWMNNNPDHCKLYDQDLVWDKRKKENGYKRLKSCKEGSA